MALFFLLTYVFGLGVWFGLAPYMLLRYRNCDLFGAGTYKPNRPA